MRILIALLALVVLVGCSQPPSEVIKPAAVRTCIDTDANGLCDDIEPKPAPVAKAPEPVVVETEPEPVVDAPVKPEPVKETPKETEARPTQAKPSSSTKSAATYFDAFEKSSSYIILDSNRNFGGAVAASSDIIAYLEFPDSLEVKAIDTYDESPADYTQDLIVLGNACTNGFVAQLYEIDTADCAGQFTDATGEIRTFSTNGHDVLVVAGSDDTVVRNIVKLMLSGKIKHAGSQQSIDLSDY